MKGIFSWLFPSPPSCPFCGRSRGNFFCCDCCWEELNSWRRDLHPCSLCGRLLPLGEGELCPFCEKAPPPFMARAAGPYRGLLKELIWEFKYRGRRSLAFPLSQLLGQVLFRDLKGYRPDLLVPVPLSSQRLKVRSFNQAELLASSLALSLGLPVEPLLLRVKDTPPLVDLSPRTRKQLVQGAFRVEGKRRLEGRKILLIDDVFTTGATVGACAEALLLSGAAEVIVLTLATGIINSPPPFL